MKPASSCAAFTLAATVLAWASSAPAGPPAGGAKLVIEDRALELRRGRGYEELRVRCEAVLDTPGRYSITPVIQVDPGCRSGWSLPGTAFGSMCKGAKPAGREEPGDDDALVVKTDSAGRVRFTVCFDGDDLWRLEQDGPWWFCCRFLFEDNIDPVTHHPPGYAWIEENLGASTRPWEYRTFARRYGGELEPYGRALFDLRSTEQLIYTQGWDLVVATVVAADSQGTNVRPPHVRLRVEECLYGSLPAGTMDARWSPEPLYVPCPVGEAGNIARWEATALPAPPVGTKWILVGKRASPPDEWTSQARCRRIYSDSLRLHFVKAAREWPAMLRMLKREAAEADRPRMKARRKEERLRRERAAEDARVRVRAERRWIGAERRVAATADIPALVRSSPDIAIGFVSLPRAPRRQGGVFRVTEWLRCSRRAEACSSRVALYIGEREDSVVKRWGMRLADVPLREGVGDSVRCIAFLRSARLPGPRGCEGATYRILDGRTGLLLADSRTVARVRSAIVARKDSAVALAPGCGASLSEFAGLSEAEAAAVGVKITWATPRQVKRVTTLPPVLILSCPAGHFPPHKVTGGWFVGCALGDRHYPMECVDSWWSLAVRPGDMRTLLDSLVASGVARGSRVDPADTLSVMLRREVGGRERVFECTLDGAAFLDLVRILTTVFPDPRYYPGPGRHGDRLDSTLDNLGSWTCAVDPRALALWRRPPGR
jgi:hypothetical protein